MGPHVGETQQISTQDSQNHIILAWLREVQPASATPYSPSRRPRGTPRSAACHSPSGRRRFTRPSRTRREMQTQPKTPRATRAATRADRVGLAHDATTTSDSQEEEDNDSPPPASPTPKPRAARQSRKPFSAYGTALSQLRAIPLGQPRSQVASSTSSRSCGGRRPRSPVKRMSDLRYAARPVVAVNAQEADDMHETAEDLLAQLQTISSAEAVIPLRIEDDVVARAKQINRRFRRLPRGCLRDEDDADDITASPEVLLAELDSLCDIVQESLFLESEGCSENHWNTNVHDPMLRLAMGDKLRENPACGVLPATSAKIAPFWVPQHQTGLALQDKLIDFCLVLSDPGIQKLSRQVNPTALSRLRNEAIRDGEVSGSATSSNTSEGGHSVDMETALHKRPPLPSTSINHTDYAPLRERPIAISIETKKPGVDADGAMAQLSLWAAAHLGRLRRLFSLGDDPVPLPLPLIFVSGHTWNVLFAVDRPNHIDIVTGVSIGGTDSLLGCYQTLAGLRALKAWSVGPFREWFVKSLGSMVNEV